jgi:hypothetical protein
LGTVALALLVGLVGTIVLAAAAGARRTSSSLARFNEQSRAASVELLPPLFARPTRAQLGALRRIRGVVAIAELRAFAVSIPDAPQTLGLAAAVDGALGRDVDRGRVLAGREPNPEAPDEIAISESAARLLHRGVGDHLDLVSYTPQQVVAGPPPRPEGPKVRLQIVGVVRRPFDLGDLAATGGNIPLTPAFARKYDGKIGDFGVVIRVRTRPGAEHRVIAAGKKVFPPAHGLATSVTTLASETEGAQNAIDVLTIALQVFAAVAAVAGIITIAIILTRVIVLAELDMATLQALGVTRTGRALIHGPRVVVIALSGGLLAALGALAASPLLPFGLARRAEPDPGVDFDAQVLVVGAIAIMLVVLAMGAVTSMRSARRSSKDPALRPSPLVTLATARLEPVPAEGLRMALTPGRGRTALPVRSACFGAIFGVLGVVAVLIFAASLDTLATTPRLYGRTWDFTVPDTAFNPVQTSCDAHTFGVSKIVGIAALAAVCDNDTQLNGRPVTIWGVTPVRGAIDPQIIAGRAPDEANEVALGAKTMHALRVDLGDTIEGRTPQGGTVNYRIVGQVVLPTIGYPQPLADGALMTGRGLAQIFDPNSRASRYLLARFALGTSHTITLKRAHGTQDAALPTEIEHIRNVDWVLLTLALVLGSLALVAIGHALVTAVRRRRHDLAMLKTLGFVRRQTRRSVAWQATILAAIGLLFGIPLGIILGRNAWRITADGLGVSYPATTTIPWLALTLGVPIVLTLVNVLALPSARTASRTNTARALRAE